MPEASAPTRDEPGTKAGGTVSLWQKIFGLPSEPAAKSQPAFEPREPGPSERWDSPPAFNRGEEPAELSFDREQPEWDEDVAEQAVDEPADESDRPSDAAADDRKQRRPRRRRRGRGRKSDEPRAAESMTSARDEKRRSEVAGEEEDDDDDVDELLDLGDEGDDDLDLPVRRSHPTADAADDDETDFDDTDFGENGATAGRSEVRAKPSGHRSIPTWDDAIGTIVEANMASRAQRKQSSHTGSRSGSSRGGRPRGSRRKKKS